MALTLLIPFVALLMPGAVFVIVSFTTERVFRLHMRPEDLERELAHEAGGYEEETDDDEAQ